MRHFVRCSLFCMNDVVGNKVSEGKSGLASNDLNAAFSALNDLRIFLASLELHPFSRFLFYFWRPQDVLDLFTSIESLVTAKLGTINGGTSDPRLRNAAMLENLVALFAFRAGLI